MRFNSARTSAQTNTGMRWLVVCLLVMGLILGVTYWLRPTPRQAQAVKVDYLRHIDQFTIAINHLQRAIVTRQPGSHQQAAFRRARLAYKRIEFLSSYYSPETTKALNGPNIPEVDDDLRINEPEGFQVLEELLFPVVDSNQHAEAVQHVAVLRSNANRLRLISQGNEMTDSHVFDAMRLEVFRLITLGITGFDSPVAFYSLPETACALESLREPLRHYGLASQDKRLADRINQTFQTARQTLLSAPDFNRFDRLSFIVQQANLLSGLLLDAQTVLSIPTFTDNRLLAPTVRTLSDSGAFDSSFFVNFNQQRATPDRVKLGQLLFFDSILSRQSGRSCASCHQPARAFTDGEPKSLATGIAGRRISRNAPTLLNAALQAVQFADSRVVFLEDQASDVIQNKEEMHGSLPEAVKSLQQHSRYKALFTKAYPEGISEASLKNALASYIRSLISLDSRFDRQLRGQTVTLTADEKRGFNLFMGKAKCATCHFFPLFNGTVPPAYQETESEVIGTPATADGRHVDTDVGKFMLTNREPHRFAFKTPTIRHVVQTAPYMHNGVFQTLEEVVDFYDKGGGNGLGFKLDNQTLPANSLHLTASEKKALVSFLKTL